MLPWRLFNTTFFWKHPGKCLKLTFPCLQNDPPKRLQEGQLQMAVLQHTSKFSTRKTLKRTAPSMMASCFENSLTTSPQLSTFLTKTSGKPNLSASTTVLHSLTVGSSSTIKTPRPSESPLQTLGWRQIRNARDVGQCKTLVMKLFAVFVWVNKQLDRNQSEISTIIVVCKKRKAGEKKNVPPFRVRWDLLSWSGWGSKRNWQLRCRSSSVLFSRCATLIDLFLIAVATKATSIWTTLIDESGCFLLSAPLRWIESADQSELWVSECATDTVGSSDYCDPIAQFQLNVR